MNTRIHLEDVSTSDIVLSVEPSYDKPHEQVVCLSAHRKGKLLAQSFIDKAEAIKLLDDLTKTIELIWFEKGDAMK